MKNKKPSSVCICIMITFCVMVCCVLTQLPMQKIKMTAKTTADVFDLSDSINLYSFNNLEKSEEHTAVIRFLAVPDTSKNLFVRAGHGQWVYLGCEKLEAKCDFIAFRQLLNIQLTLKAAQTDLKLEDGTPFDITAYSLKPVLTIEE